ncbi:sterol carrier protein-2 had-2scp-2 [Cystoisospora suis]|uniref:Sterol carrier protein-2 had-2scp-2 n=1 Tax=Cystoisospora suis TaxID=483139 RepID=A0A2C6L4V2_9APIC|nr:sterol carrier protein-2 had-2scp-2 [Cystoisospora suis]
MEEFSPEEKNGDSPQRHAVKRVSGTIEEVIAVSDTDTETESETDGAEVGQTTAEDLCIVEDLPNTQTPCVTPVGRGRTERDPVYVSQKSVAASVLRSERDPQITGSDSTSEKVLCNQCRNLVSLSHLQVHLDEHMAAFLFQEANPKCLASTASQALARIGASQSHHAQERSRKQQELQEEHNQLTLDGFLRRNTHASRKTNLHDRESWARSLLAIKMPIRFDGQVAIVTGSGGGLGRAYALLLAAHGAKVLVNDLGAALSGFYNQAAEGSAPADKVVAEIRANGGEAEPDYNSVLDGQKIIDHAMSKFGRVDILVNNAGVLRDASFLKMTDADWNLVLDVHVKGAYACTKAAWPIMMKQNYGRIVMTASAAGLYGNFGQANYSTAKSALVGFSKTLAFEGARKNIVVNCIAPLAGTRMTATVMPSDLVEALKPEYVAPVVAYLCSGECHEGGQVLEVGAGWVATVRWQRNSGHSFKLPFSVDDVSREWKRIGSFEGNLAYPTSLQGSMMMVTKQLDYTASQPKSGSSKAAQGDSSRALSLEGQKTEEHHSRKVSNIFRMMDAHLLHAPGAKQKLQEEVDCIFGFNITSGKTTDSWSLDLKKGGSGRVREGAHGSPDVLFTMAEEHFVPVCLGELNPQMAFLQGKMKIKGSMAKAAKFSPLLFPPISREMVELSDSESAVSEYLKKHNVSVSSASAGARKTEVQTKDTAVGGVTSARKLQEQAVVNDARPSTAAMQLKSLQLYEIMRRHLATPEGAKLVKKIRSVYRLNILPKKGASPVKVVLDLKNIPPSIREETGSGAETQCDCTITLLDEDFVKLAMGKMNPQLAFMQGKIKLRGSMQAALKFTPDIFPKNSKL